MRDSCGYLEIVFYLDITKNQASKFKSIVCDIIKSQSKVISLFQVPPCIQNTRFIYRSWTIIIQEQVAIFFCTINRHQLWLSLHFENFLLIEISSKLLFFMFLIHFHRNESLFLLLPCASTQNNRKMKNEMILKYRKK